MRYICKYAKLITAAGDIKYIQCDGSSDQCSLDNSGTFTEKCLSKTRTEIPERVFSKSIEEHEKRFHNIKKDC